MWVRIFKQSKPLNIKMNLKIRTKQLTNKDCDKKKWKLINETNNWQGRERSKEFVNLSKLVIIVMFVILFEIKWTVQGFML